MWTVIGKDSQVEEGSGHAFLILSRSDQTTMVLQTGKEINELVSQTFSSKFSH